MNDQELRKRLWTVNRELATLRFEYYSLFISNRSLALKLFGFNATSPEKFQDQLLKRMDFYLTSARA